MSFRGSTHVCIKCWLPFYSEEQVVEHMCEVHGDVAEDETAGFQEIDSFVLDYAQQTGDVPTFDGGLGEVS